MTRPLNSRMVPLVFVALLMCASLCVEAVSAQSATGEDSTGYSSHEGDKTLDLVYEHIRTAAPNLTQFQRELVLNHRSVREITSWPFQDRLRKHRLFSYPGGSHFHHGAYVLAVDVPQIFKVWDIRTFNRVLTDEGVRITSEVDAKDAAILFLKLHHAWETLYLGYEMGVNPLTSVDDIPFVDERERSEVSAEYDVTPPTISVRNHEFIYFLWSWQRDGNGLLATHEVVLNDTGVVSYESTPLKSGVGQWVGLR